MDLFAFLNARHGPSHLLSPLAPVVDALGFSYARTLFSAQRRWFRRGHLPCRRNGQPRMGGKSVLSKTGRSGKRAKTFRSEVARIHHVGNGALHKTSKPKVLDLPFLSPATRGEGRRARTIRS